MTSHDELDITSWLQSEGRRLASPRAKAVTHPSSSNASAQQQASTFDHRWVASGTEAASPTPGSLSEVLWRMELEKQTRSRIR